MVFLDIAIGDEATVLYAFYPICVSNAPGKLEGSEKEILQENLNYPPTRNQE